MLAQLSTSGLDEWLGATCVVGRNIAMHVLAQQLILPFLRPGHTSRHAKLRRGSRSRGARP